ncbi:hypothetical protein [Actinokineospora globicatena]|uniref:hypothetical protein n=1 Tax=Actinokineospora globicatena TaxID=103729 RepID=UPI0020A36AED|nr:hypothetical protein [Actinokineospora globicatena]MCP2304232.1 hypothetical protein [Actinokineospora globicatena]GLW78408.1 hypothetical protein Aglo01_28900 [Actinokineospora globicatena]GLW84928.1 hypothetical protein Aglo02_25680 [Actinokineospora globicatena]
MSATPPLTRRALLLATAAAGLAACTPAPAAPPPPDPLAALAARARSDAALANAIATAVPALAAPAALVAKSRGEHAELLQREVDRERPPKPSSSGASAAPTTTQAPSAPTDQAAAVKALTDGLTSAQREAIDVVAGVPRYRAGMVGSVAAGCASLVEVLA